MATTVSPHGTVDLDEVAYESQANAIAHHQLTLPVATHDPFFRPFLSGVRGDRIVFKYQPEWPALMAVARGGFGSTLPLPRAALDRGHARHRVVRVGARPGRAGRPDRGGVDRRVAVHVGADGVTARLSAAVRARYGCGGRPAALGAHADGPERRGCGRVARGGVLPPALRRTGRDRARPRLLAVVRGRESRIGRRLLRSRVEGCPSWRSSSRTTGR